MKVKNLLFVVLFCAFVLAPMALNVAVKTGCELPEWLMDERLEYLEGDVSTVNVEEHLDIEEFTSGELQKAVETDIEGNVPFKSNAILTNAGAQRTCIEASNMLFGWGCYPTYFGSKRLFGEMQGSLYRFPSSKTKSKTDMFEKFVRYMDEIASAYPGKQFYVYFVDSSSLDQSNPAKRLISNETNSVSEYVTTAALSSQAANIAYVGDEVSKAENYHAYFYTSDHHWNGYGTKRAYEVISRLAGLDAAANPIESSSSFDGLRINGSEARIGLMLLDEPVNEPLFDFSQVRIISGNMAPVYASATDFSEATPLKAEFGFYHSWFGTGNLVLENDSREGKVLLVGDSYTYSLRWLFGNSCHTLVQRGDFVDGRPEKIKEEGRTMRYFIDSTNPDKVVLAASPSDFVNMIEKFEGYFS